MRRNGAADAIRVAACLALALPVLSEAQTPRRRVLVRPPVLEIGGGGADTEMPIGNYRGAAFLDSTRLVLCDGFEREIRVFTLSGDFVRSFGREGKGPGEFASVRLLGLEDRGPVEVWDPELGRVTLFSTSGEVLETITYRRDLLQNPLAPVVATLSDGRIILRDGPGAFERAGYPEGRFRERTIFVRLDPGAGIRKLVELPGDELFHNKTESGFGSTGVLFGHELFHDQYGPGFIVAATDREAAVVYSETGEPIRRIPYPPSRGEVTEADVRAERERRLAEAKARAERRSEFMKRASEKSGMARMGTRFLAVTVEGIRNAPANDTYPAISDLVVDRAGRIWMAHYPEPTASEVRWTFWKARANRPSGTVAIPRGYELVDALGDLVLLHSETSLGSDVLTVYRLAESSNTMSGSEARSLSTRNQEEEPR